MNGELIRTGYRPRPQQAEIHAALRRFNVLVCHRRFGKTVLAINETVDRALRCTADRPRYAYIAPFYRQAKQAAWDYMKIFTAALPDIEARETELRIDFAGGRRLQLFGADNPDALRGMYFDGVVFDPPRAGAKEQAEELARSDVARIVAVSCNPQTLGRDLAILRDGGYSIDTVVPVDQFFWSAHVEAVACLRRK